MAAEVRQTTPQPSPDVGALPTADAGYVPEQVQPSAEPEPAAVIVPEVAAVVDEPVNGAAGAAPVEVNAAPPPEV